MNVYELTVKIYLLNNMKVNHIGYHIGNFINGAMKKDKDLSKLHNRNNLKHYCFSELYPIEEGFSYNQNGVYTFSIRSADLDLIMKFDRVLQGAKDNNFIVITMSHSEVPVKKIKGIRTIMPVICTVRENEKFRSLTIDKDGEEAIKEKIFYNLNYKYKKLNNVDLTTSFDSVFENIIIKPKVKYIYYKNIMFLGYKAILYFKDNSLAQDFARIALAEGVGEKNSSCGAGFGQVMRYC